MWLVIRSKSERSVIGPSTEWGDSRGYAVSSGRTETVVAATGVRPIEGAAGGPLRLLELVERFDFCRRQCPVVDADVNSNSARGKH